MENPIPTSFPVEVILDLSDTVPLYSNVSNVNLGNGDFIFDFGFVDFAWVEGERLRTHAKSLISVPAKPVARVMTGVQSAMRLRDRLTDLIEKFEEMQNASHKS